MWKYKVVALMRDLPADLLQVELAKHGVEGWELVSIYFMGGTHQLIFKMKI